MSYWNVGLFSGKFLLPLYVEYGIAITCAYQTTKTYSFTKHLLYFILKVFFVVLKVEICNNLEQSIIIINRIITKHLYKFSFRSCSKYCECMDGEDKQKNQHYYD